MGLPVIGMIGDIASEIIGGVRDHFAGKRKVKQAIVENKIRLAASEQTHNQAWEIKQIDNSGWKDDVLFYAWIGFFAWTAIDPETARVVFDNWSQLPDWFLELTFWIVGSVIGVRKIGQELPVLVSGVKSAVKRKE